MMNQDPQLKRYTYTIEPTHGVTIHHIATEVRCMSATASFQLQLGDSPETEFATAIKYTSKNGTFSKVRIRNDNDFPITVTLAFAVGGIEDASTQFSGAISAYQEAARNVADGTIQIASGERKLIAAAQVDRLKLYVSHVAGSGVVFIGGPNVLTNKGLPLAAGHTHSEAMAGDVYAYNQSNSVTTLSTLEYLK